MASPLFRDPSFWRQQINAFFQNNPQFYSPANQALLEKEFLNLLEFSKTFAENLANTCLTVFDAANVIKFVWLAQKLGFTNHNIETIFNHITGLRGDARLFINAVGSNLLGVQEAAAKIGRASVVFLIITVAIQVYIHYRRGEYGLAFGEIIKTILAVGCFPFAVIDMFDQLLCAIAPNLMKHWFVRMLRGLNGLQGAKHLANTILTLGSVVGYAWYHNIEEVNKSLANLVEQWSQSPQYFFAEASGSLVETLERKNPGLSKYEWIRNLAEYWRNNPPEWNKYQS